MEEDLAEVEADGADFHGEGNTYGITKFTKLTKLKAGCRKAGKFWTGLTRFTGFLGGKGQVN
jgi:hypothetical protein